jgi:ppGpp synthetase/RelA/SpoT-type nucleotidyltranferase
LAKARKKSESGDNIYEDPIWDITDQLAARIVVRFKTELGIIEKMIRKTYRFIEIDPKEPNSPKEFGYFGLHFLLAIPDEIIPQSLDSDDIPQVFELQLKTLFQHAWAEVEHDITYKPSFKWNEEHKRKIAFTAAQAWGADEIFDELYQKRFDTN